MELDQEQLKKLKEIQTDLLLHFIETCGKIGVRYYVTGGTLLGAVRHQGFIPWDDDIDVCMLREDYDKWTREAGQYLPDYIFLQTCETDKQFYKNFARLRNNRTTFILSKDRELGIHHGVFIDIFPMDNYPESFLRKRLFHLKKLFYSANIISNTSRGLSVKNRIKYYVKRCAQSITRNTSHSAVMKRERLYRSIPITLSIANHSGSYGKREIVPREWFVKSAKLVFEAIEVNAPANFDAYLSRIYGDYMILPPVEKRAPHHYVDSIQLDNGIEGQE